jgi:hypothetical protein
VQRDTVWLECTDNHSPANVLGTFTDGRDGLLINGEQSKLVHTPTRSAEENLQVRTSLLRFLNTDISAEVKTTYTGFQADDLRLRFVEASSKDQQQWILSQWKMPSATLQDFSLKGLSTYDTVITMTLKGTVQYYANISQNRLFFQPILLDRRTTIPTAIKHRYSPIRYSYPYHDIDTMVYILPAQYALEAAPGDTVISSSFGNYSLTIRHRDSDTLVVVRNIRIRTKTIPKERYEEYRKFYSDIAKLEKTKVILHWKL